MDQIPPDVWIVAGIIVAVVLTLLGARQLNVQIGRAHV